MRKARGRVCGHVLTVFSLSACYMYCLWSDTGLYGSLATHCYIDRASMHLYRADVVSFEMFDGTTTRLEHTLTRRNTPTTFPVCADLQPLPGQPPAVA